MTLTNNRDLEQEPQKHPGMFGISASGIILSDGLNSCLYRCSILTSDRNAELGPPLLPILASQRDIGMHSPDKNKSKKQDIIALRYSSLKI